MRLRLLAASAVLALAGCVGAPGQLALSGPSCPSLFRQLDTAERFDRPRIDDASTAVPSAIEPIAGRLRTYDCLSSPDRAGMAAALADPSLPRGDGVRRPSGALIAVGAVTGTRADFHTLDYFEALGWPAYSLGTPGVGRRIYVGPVASEAGVAAVMEAAARAGFRYPYVKRGGPSYFGGIVGGVINPG
jgi:hypothetical protein